MNIMKHETATNISLKGYLRRWADGRLNMPKWQRNQQRVWDEHGPFGYRSELIFSIMSGIDLPKIYLGKVVDMGTIIIDGGHRTRAFKSFTENEFSYPDTDPDSDFSHIYYSSVNHASDRSRIFTGEEREYFDKYFITTVTYTDITEHEARNIFNRLQNAAPMSMPDVVNCWESDLVEWFRDVRKDLLDGKDDYKHLVGMKLPHPETNGDLYQFLSWFTIVNPKAETESHAIDALKCVEMGKTRESTCFKYLKDFNRELLKSEKIKFRKTVDTVVTFLKDNQDICSSWAGDIPTLIHADIYVHNFSLELFVKLLEDIKIYKGLVAGYKKENEAKRHAEAVSMQEKSDALNRLYGLDLEKWVKSRAQNPSGPKRMGERNAMVVKWCVEDGED